MGDAQGKPVPAIPPLIIHRLGSPPHHMDALAANMRLFEGLRPLRFGEVARVERGPTILKRQGDGGLVVVQGQADPFFRCMPVRIAVPDDVGNRLLADNLQRNAA